MSFKTMIVSLTLISLFICNVKTQTKSQIASTSPSIPVTEIVLNDDEIHSWASRSYPYAYPKEDSICIIKASPGYYISITVETLDLDGTSGDFLMIKPGDELHDKKKGKVFTFNLNSPRKYLINSNNAYMSFHVFGNNNAKNKGFLIKYQRIGEEVTTTEEPTTDVTWPTPSGSDSIYLTVYVSGKTQEDFSNNETLYNFKAALAEMATEYCNENHFELTDSITTKNIQIYHLIQCPYTWPDSNTCIKARFALPVLLQNNSSYSGYQLNTTHLELMWDHLANKYLEKYGILVYTVPDNNSSLTMWVVVSCVTLILFLILLYFVKMVGPNFSTLKTMKRRSSDTSGIISKEPRVSNMSLRPHPLQVTPPFFDNDYAFQQFEPDVGIPSRTFDYPLSEDDSDTEIIFTNFSNSRNNIPDKENTESIS